MSELRTIQLVNNGEVISPLLTTTREYGSWFEETFDEYTSTNKMYMKSRTKNGKVVLENHPGTRIGDFFDHKQFHLSELHSWFILQDTKAMETIVKYGLAEKRDAIPISVNDEKHRNMLRLYTTQQIEYYIKTKLDKHFSIAKYIVSQARKVTVANSEMNEIIKPKISNKRNSKLNNVQRLRQLNAF